ERARVAPYESRRLVHGERVTRLVEVAVVAEVHVVDRAPLLDLEGPRTAPAGRGEQAEPEALLDSLAGLGVADHLVGPAETLERALGGRVRVGVRMERPCLAPERVPDLALGRGAWHAQHRVRVTGAHARHVSAAGAGSRGPATTS